MENRHGKKYEDQTGVILEREEFSLILHKTKLRPEQWARICVIFRMLDEVMTEDDDPLDWGQCG